MPEHAGPSFPTTILNQYIMRKIFYALSLAVMASASSFGADETGLLEWKMWPYANTSVHSTTMVNFGPGKYYDIITQGDEVEITDLKTWNAMRFSAQAATEYAGTTLKEIHSVSGFFDNPSEETIKVSLAWSLDEEPFFTREYTPLGSTFDMETFEIVAQTDVIPVDMDEPFVIEAGKEFYVIFEYTEHDADTGEYAVYLNEGMAPAKPGSSYTALEGSAIVNGETRTFTKEFKDNTDWLMGSALAASLILSGTGLPSNLIDVDAVSAPARVFPDVPFDVTATVRNAGGNSVSEITAVCDVNGEKTEKTFSIDDLAFSHFTEITFTGLSTDVDGGVVPVSVEVTAVNGVENAATGKSKSTTTFSINDGFSKNVLVEEYTGTWCGWCVRGIVAMEKTYEKHDDGSFIGLAVHAGDEMEPLDADYILGFMQGAPSMNVSREYISDVSPTLMEEAYEDIRATPAVARIDLTGTMEDDGIHVESEVTFRIDDEFTEYRVGYVMVEDNVGPYTQNNYYSGGGHGEMGGFEDMDKAVDIMYDDVVRYYKGCDGIEGSLPLSVQKEQVYTHSDILPYTNVANKDNVWIAAFLVNASNGTIANAVRLTHEDMTGVQNIAADGDNQIEYYNLQGIRILNPEKGMLLIRRDGARAARVIF